jgi:hypothetical protein
MMTLISALAASKFDARYKNGQKEFKNNHLATLLKVNVERTKT